MTIRTAVDLAVIDAKTVRRLIAADMEGCVRIVAEAYLAHDAGLTVNPQSVFLRFPDAPSARIIALPAHLRGPRPVSGMKWIASYPENRRLKLPRASAVLILNDAQTGFPFACIEASAISASRTAASAVLAAEHIRRRVRAADSLGVVGSGVIARHVIQFLFGTGWEMGTINVHDSSPDALAEFGEWLGGLRRNLRMIRCDTAQDVCEKSDIVLFATVATEPYVSDPRCLSRNQTVLHLSLRDLAPAIILASNNVVDDRAHIVSAATSVALAAAASGGTRFITCTLADLLLKRSVLADGHPTVFSPFGLGVLDLAVGRWIFDRSVAEGSCTTLAGFFDTDNSA